MDKILPEVATVPTFLLKLVNLLKDEDNQEYASWNDTGTSFIVKDQVGFARNVLPKYFKHNKFASFVRQLNMYGFRKITSLTQSGLKVEKEEVEFYHYLFIRDQEYLLDQIKRKVTKPDDSSRHSDEIVKVLSDVTQLKTKQKDINSKLSDLKQENEILWKEVVDLRQKHSHQQKVVNKLIQFLVNLVQQHGMGVKRKLPLMIEDGSGDSNYPPHTKSLKQFFSSEDRPDIDNQSAVAPTVYYPPSINPDSSADSSQSTMSQSSTGPYITEINSPGDNKDEANETPALLEIPSNDNLMSPLDIGFDMSEYVNPDTRNNITGDVFTPVPLTDLATQEPNNQPTTQEPINQPTTSNISPVTATSQNELTQYFPLKRSLSNHVDLIQNNLNNIQERLANKDQIQLDYGLIQELFGTSPDIMPILLNNTDESSITGNELVLHKKEDEDVAQFQEELNDLADNL